MNAAGRLLAHAAVLLAPVLFPQGIYTRLRATRLPEAAGDRHGRVGTGRPILRLLVLGESTAAGVGAQHHGDSLAGQTAQALHEAIGASIDWQVLAANGLTASMLRERLDELPAESRCDLVVIGLGANDVFRLRGPGGWSRDLHALIAAVRERCGHAPVMLSAAPPIGQFPGLPQPLRAVLGLRARLLDHASTDLARKVPGVHFVPLEFAVEPELFAVDGIHPSPRAYRLWGVAVAQAAVGLLPGRA